MGNKVKNLLKIIVDDELDFYLDKIQEEPFGLGGGWRSASYTIWRQLTEDIGYSLQVATDISYDTDKVEQEEFLQALGDWGVDPNQLIFLDESRKDPSSSGRCRCWTKKGGGLFREAYLAGTHGQRHTLLAVCDINRFVLESCSRVK